LFLIEVSTMETIYTTPDIQQAQLVRMELEKEGIDVFCRMNKLM